MALTLGNPLVVRRRSDDEVFQPFDRTKQRVKIPVTIPEPNSSNGLVVQPTDDYDLQITVVFSFAGRPAVA